MSDTKKISIWAALIALVITALYGQFLYNPIVFDDLYFFLQDADGHSAIAKFASLSMGDLRGLPNATLAWTAEIFGFGLPPFRIGNFLLHFFVVIGLAFFLSRLYQVVLHKGVEVGGERTGRLVAVLIAVSLFALHPLTVYAVGYLVQRTIVMATLFSVLALWAYLHGHEKRNTIWLWGSVGLYFLATHSKEHVIMLPVIVVAMVVLVSPDWRVHLRKQWPIFAGYAAVALLTLVEAWGVLSHAYEINADEMLANVSASAGQESAVVPTLLLSILTQSYLFFKYLFLWVLPSPAWQSVDMREPFAHGFFSIYGVALLAYLAYGIVALRLLLRRGQLGVIGFAMLFPWLLFMTEFSTVRIQEVFVLYRSYVWAIGGVIILPLLLMRLNGRLAMLLSVLFAGVLFMLSMERLATFSHPVLLWDDAEKLVTDRQSLPGVDRIYYNRGTELLKAEMFDRALVDLQTAVKLNPKWPEPVANLGLTYSKIGQNELAVQSFSQAIALAQKYKGQERAKYYSGRAAAYEALGKSREAAADYQMVCRITGRECDKF